MTAHADRLPPLPPAQWSSEQHAYVQEIVDGPRGALISPFVPLMRSPELMGHAQRMGEYLRYRSSLGLRLSELAILIVARHWSQPVEWAIHAPIAEREGIAATTLDALAHGRRPDRMPPDESVLHAFCVQLLETQRVDDATWSEAVATFGEKGVVDLIGLSGYYSMLAMVMNAAQTDVPAGPALPDPN